MANFPDIDKYSITKELGIGGFGKVYLAQDIQSHGNVAIKFIKTNDPKRQQELIKEIQVIDSLDHPNVIKYRTHLWHDESLCFVMDYCEKGNLYQAAKSASLEQIIKWIKECSQTISYLHSKGVFHNDLKPANILVSGQGVLKISDFGCANLSWGTRPYLPPEMLLGETDGRGDARRDIYALGVSLLELATSNNPFANKSHEEIIQLHRSGNIEMKGIPVWLQEIIFKSIDQTPEIRFQTASEFAEALESGHVPSILNRSKLNAGHITDRINWLISRKKWVKAQNLVEEGTSRFPTDVALLKAAGQYYLNRNHIQSARSSFLSAIRYNPRIDVQKELGLCQLEIGNHAQAISLLNDHLSRSGLDVEVYNALIRCYFETSRYEYAIQVADELLSSKQLKADCLVNNRMICKIMLGERDFPDLNRFKNPFIKYHIDLLNEGERSFTSNGTPSLKSKLLFQDFRFNGIKDNSNQFWVSEKSGPDPQDLNDPREVTKALYKIGRTEYNNDLEFPTTMVSRRHAVILNQKDDTWLYDLKSTGTRLNGQLILNRHPLKDRSEIDIKGFTIIYISDIGMLL